MDESDPTKRFPLTGALKDLYETFPDDEKLDFMVAYVYLKYTSTFLHRTADKFGFATTSHPPEPLDPGLELFIHSYLDTMLRKAGSVETIPYASKVVKPEDASQLLSVDEDIDIRNANTVIPYGQANNIVIRNPTSIAVGKCACRLAREDHCEPMGKGLDDDLGLECCFFIGDPYASVIAEENPRFRKCSQEEAVEIMHRSHEAGAVQMAFWKKELNRNFYSICNCCSCCCLGILVHNQFRGAIPCVQSSGYMAEVDTDRCNGCRICQEYCQFSAIAVDGESETAVVDVKECMGCEICKTKCPEDAISLVRNPQVSLEPVDLSAIREAYRP